MTSTKEEKVVNATGLGNSVLKVLNQSWTTCRFFPRSSHRFTFQRGTINQTEGQHATIPGDHYLYQDHRKKAQFLFATRSKINLLMWSVPNQQHISGVLNKQHKTVTHHIIIWGAGQRDSLKTTTRKVSNRSMCVRYSAASTRHWDRIVGQTHLKASYKEQWLHVLQFSVVIVFLHLQRNVHSFPISSIIYFGDWHLIGKRGHKAKLLHVFY